MEIRVRNRPLCSSISFKDVFICINTCNLVEDMEVTVEACADIGTQCSLQVAKSKWLRAIPTIHT